MEARHRAIGTPGWCLLAGKVRRRAERHSVAGRTTQGAQGKLGQRSPVVSLTPRGDGFGQTRIQWASRGPGHRPCFAMDGDAGSHRRRGARSQHRQRRSLGPAARRHSPRRHPAARLGHAAPAFLRGLRAGMRPLRWAPARPRRGDRARTPSEACSRVSVFRPRRPASPARETRPTCSAKTLATDRTRAPVRRWSGVPWTCSFGWVLQRGRTPRRLITSCPQAPCSPKMPRTPFSPVRLACAYQQFTPGYACQ